MRIVIGSTNPVKCNAVQAVFAPLYPDASVQGIDVPSHVASQPWGNVETRQGALNRAKEALMRSPADIAVGLEGGVQETEFGLMTCAWAIIVDSNGRVGIGGNSSILRPHPLAEQTRAGRELGHDMDQFSQRQNTKHENGAIGILTNDLETRQSAYEHITRLALASFQHPDWYPLADPS